MLKRIFVLCTVAVIIISCKSTPPADTSANNSNSNNSGNTVPNTAETGAIVLPPIVPAASGVAQTFVAPVSGAYTIAFGTSNLDIVRAVSEMDYAKTQKQLDARQPPNTVDSLGNSILLYAIDKGDANIVQLLIQKGANVNLGNKQNQTPLLYAVSKNNKRIVELVAAGGASINQTDSNGVIPLWIAVQNRNAEIAQYLLSKGAAVNVRDSLNNTALHIAVANDDVPMVRVLLQNGADVYIANSSGITALALLKQAQRPELRQLAEKY